MESGEKTEVRSWKLEVESQKSEVGGRTKICNVRNVRCNSQVRSWKSEVGSRKSGESPRLSRLPIMPYLYTFHFPIYKGFKFLFRILKIANLSMYEYHLYITECSERRVEAKGRS